MRLDPFVRTLVNEARHRRFTYLQFNEHCKIARKVLGLKRPRGPRTLPRLLPDNALEQFYETIDRTQNIQHQIMLRLLFYTAIRVGELVKIEIGDVDLAANKIYINQGKGSKDRYVLFPDSFALVLQAHLAGHPDNVYLFESNRKTHYSRRWIEKIVEKYARAAGLRVHPHLLRHQMLSFLTQGKLSDAQIQLISGHSSKKSLEVYQHLSLAAVAEDYQQAVKKVKV
jgi:integrase/recombinase XerD